MKFSKRTGWMSQENALTKALSEKKRCGTAILDLTQSNPTHCGFDYLDCGLLPALADAKNLSYDPDPMGLLEAREAVCAYYAEKNIKVSPDQVFLTAGTSEAYSFLFRLLADPGDVILAPKPSYPLFDFLSELNDIHLEKYPLVYADGWRCGGPELESLFKKRPQAVILVNPNNPTGNFVSENEKETVNRLCEVFGLAVIVDEVFLDFAWEDDLAATTSFAGNEEVLTFTLGGVSKMLGLPQMKVSWIVLSGPEDLRLEAAKRLEIIADTYLSVNTPSQRALPFWFSHRQKIVEEIRQRVLSNRRSLAEKLKGHRSACLLHAEGGWQVVLKIQSSLSDEELTLKLLGEKNILVYPGYFFDFEEGNFLVLSLLLPAREFQEAIDRLSFV